MPRTTEDGLVVASSSSSSAPPMTTKKTGGKRSAMTASVSDAKDRTVAGERLRSSSHMRETTSLSTTVVADESSSSHNIVNVNDNDNNVVRETPSPRRQPSPLSPNARRAMTTTSVSTIATRSKGPKSSASAVVVSKKKKKKKRPANGTEDDDDEEEEASVVSHALKREVEIMLSVMQKVNRNTTTKDSLASSGQPPSSQLTSSLASSSSKAAAASRPPDVILIPQSPDLLAPAPRGGGGRPLPSSSRSITKKSVSDGSIMSRSARRGPRRPPSSSSRGYRPSTKQSSQDDSSTSPPTDGVIQRAVSSPDLVHLRRISSSAAYHRNDDGNDHERRGSGREDSAAITSSSTREHTTPSQGGMERSVLSRTSAAGRSAPAHIMTTTTTATPTSQRRRRRSHAGQPRGGVHNHMATHLATALMQQSALDMVQRVTSQFQGDDNDNGNRSRNDDNKNTAQRRSSFSATTTTTTPRGAKQRTVDATATTGEEEKEKGANTTTTTTTTTHHARLRSSSSTDNRPRKPVAFPRKDLSEERTVPPSASGLDTMLTSSSSCLDTASERRDVVVSRIDDNGGPVHRVIVAATGAPSHDGADCRKSSSSSPRGPFPSPWNDDPPRRDERSNGPGTNAAAAATSTICSPCECCRPPFGGRSKRISDALEQSVFMETLGTCGIGSANHGRIWRRVLMSVALFSTVLGGTTLLVSDLAMSQDPRRLERYALQFGEATVFHRRPGFLVATTVDISLGLRAVGWNRFNISMPRMTRDEEDQNENLAVDDSVMLFDTYGKPPTIVTDFEDLCNGDSEVFFVDPTQCSKCEESSKAMVGLQVLATILYGFSCIADMLRLFPTYDVNLVKLFAGLIALFTAVLGMTTFFRFRSYCLQSFLHGEYCFDSAWDVIPGCSYETYGDFRDAHVFVNFVWSTGSAYVFLGLSAFLRFVNLACHLLLATPRVTPNKEKHRKKEQIATGQLRKEKGTEKNSRYESSMQSTSGVHSLDIETTQADVTSLDLEHETESPGLPVFEEAAFPQSDDGSNV